MWLTIILLVIVSLFLTKDYIFIKIIENSNNIKGYVDIIKDNFNIKIVVISVVILYFIYDLKYYYKIIIIGLIIAGVNYRKNLNYALNQLLKLKDGDIYINHFNII